MIKGLLENNSKYAVLALNWKFPSFFAQIWNNASCRVCADGGANRVLGVKGAVHPDVVVGDLDSVDKETRKMYESVGTKFVRVFDQDYNDVEKSLRFMADCKEDIIYILGGIGGRFDQTIGVLQAAYKAITHRIVLLDEKNLLTWVYPKDKGIIPPKQWSRRTCGLLPIAGPVRHIKSKGLKWDVDFSLSMDGIVSSSNEIVDDTIHIETSDPVLWMNRIVSPYRK